MQEEVSVRGVFEKDVIGSITEVVKGPKAAREITKKRVEDRLTNKVGNKRRVHILYKHETPQFSNFSKYLSKYFDGSLEEYVKNREEQLQEVSGIACLMQTKFMEERQRSKNCIGLRARIRLTLQQQGINLSFWAIRRKFALLGPPIGSKKAQKITYQLDCCSWTKKERSSMS